MVYLVGHSWEECSWYSLVDSLEWDVPGIVSWTVLGEMFMVTWLDILGRDFHGKVRWTSCEGCSWCSLLDSLGKDVHG